MLNNLDKFTGEDFLLNPEYVFSRATNKANHYDLSVYIGLASYRNYTDFIFKKQTSLPIHFIPPFVPDSVVTGNKFLEIVDEQVIFRGEQ